MSKLLSAVLLSIALLVLGACASDNTPKISKEVADKYWPASTQEARAVRVCMASAIVAEVWVYRLIWEGGTPAEKAGARGVILTMMKDVSDVQTMSETMWFQTSMFYALNSLVRQAGPLVKSRILDTVANAATGNIGALVAELRTTAGQVALTDAMIKDITPIFEAENPDMPKAWAACQTRLLFNYNQL